MSITIRLATPNDLAAVAVLFDQYRQFYGQPVNPALALHFLSQRMHNGESVLLVADSAAHGLVGFCQLYPSFCSVAAAPICVLYDLFVSPAARAQGIGRQLLLAAEARAIADGKVRMDLSTARTNITAQTLYESLGWVRDQAFFVYSRHLRQP